MNDIFGCTVSDCRPGLYVTRIIEGGMAHRIGIEAGDKILEIDGHHVERVSETDTVRLSDKIFFYLFMSQLKMLLFELVFKLKSRLSKNKFTQTKVYEHPTYSGSTTTTTQI